MQIHNQTQYQCASGMTVRRSSRPVNYLGALEELRCALDSQKGVLLASSFEFPGRYTRWDIGFVNPPLQFVAKGRRLVITALNIRGEILLPEVYSALQNSEFVAKIDADQTSIKLSVVEDTNELAEELRSRRPSIFSVLREIVSCFSSD